MNLNYLLFLLKLKVVFLFRAKKIVFCRAAEAIKSEVTHRKSTKNRISLNEWVKTAKL